MFLTKSNPFPKLFSLKVIRQTLKVENEQNIINHRTAAIVNQ